MVVRIPDVSENIRAMSCMKTNMPMTSFFSLGRELMKRGAKVHFIIQDAKDGIRNQAILKNSKRETCMGKAIPLNQVARLKQRCDAVNALYRKDKGRYKRAISFMWTAVLGVIRQMCSSIMHPEAVREEY
mgnify:CR=1 FL=1